MTSEDLSLKLLGNWTAVAFEEGNFDQGDLCMVPIEELAVCICGWNHSCWPIRGCRYQGSKQTKKKRIAFQLCRNQNWEPSFILRHLCEVTVFPGIAGRLHAHEISREKSRRRRAIPGFWNELMHWLEARALNYSTPRRPWR